LRRNRRKFEARKGRNSVYLAEQKDGTFSMSIFLRSPTGVNASWYAAGMSTWDEAIACLRAAWPECPL
jgi:hypothetical protein